MRFFFRSKQFKIILAIFLSVILITTISGILGKKMVPTADIAGTIAAPFRSLASDIGGFFKNLNQMLSSGNELLLEKTELEAKVNELNGKLAEYDKAIAENEFLKQFIELKEANPDFKFTSATLISRDSDDPYLTFVINEGSASGVSLYDPVINEAGLIGYISELGTTTSKVTTILSPNLIIGALDNRSSDSGLISGTLQYAEKGKCKLYNLSRSCSVAIGDYIVTSGEGIFPDGLIIGSIESIGNDPYNTSIYAEVTPFVDFNTIKNVMVITEFAGQGGLK